MNTRRLHSSLSISVALLVSALSAGAADYYVSPAGNGNGSIGSPWSLGTALSSGARPGDTIWLRGGTYSGSFTSFLTGAAGAPITVRQYPGERAILDGSSAPGLATLTINGSYAWYWGFEVMNSDPIRILGTSGSAGRGFGVTVNGPNTKVINVVVHDTGQGFSFWAPATDSELYGNIIYYNGWDGPDRGHGHGIYVQNQNGAKTIADNIIFDQFSYGIHAYAETGYINNLTFDGNFSFNNGSPSFSGYTNNILVSATNVAQNPALQNNATYYMPSVGKGYNTVSNCSNANINNNYFVSGYFAISLPTCTPATMAGNTFWGFTPGWIGPAYPNNTYYVNRPAGVKVIVRPNRYEPGRANIAIYNWDNLGTVNVDVSSTGLGIGQNYEIRDVQNYLAGPLVRGTYQGGPISIPLGGLAKAPPIGSVAAVPPHTAAEFGVFVLLPSGAAIGGDTIPPSVTLTSPGAGATVSGPVTVTASASDNVGVAGVQFKLDGSPLGAEVTSAPYSVSWDSTKSSNTAHTLTATARDAAGNQNTASVSVNVGNPVSGGGFALRVRAGGPAYTDTQGRQWSADFGFSGTGGVYTAPNAILGTSDQPLYQSERWTWPGALQYDFAVPTGTYTVNLKFAENYATASGQRVFNIAINGQTVLASFDIFAQAGGPNRAIDKQFTVSSSGAITIQFTPVVGGPKIGAIEILQGSAPPATVAVSLSPGSATLSASQTQQFTATVTGSADTSVRWSLNPGALGTLSATGLYTAPSSIPATQPVTVTATSNADPGKSASATITLQPSTPPVSSFTLRVRAGGPAYTDSQGRQWTADFGYSGAGGVYTTSNAILGTSDQPLYQSERWTWPGALQYDFAVPTGTYTVNLKFAENYATAAGQRVFNIAINGQTVLASFDIFAQAGGANRAIDKQFTVSSSGAITIQFTPVVGGPKVGAIEILQGGAPPATVAVSLAPGSATLSASQIQQFTATVTGSADTSVRWSLNPGALGTLSAVGLYTAPSSIPATQPVTVTATSNADPAKSASATITLQGSTPPVSSFTLRVRAGGPAYTDSQSRQWSADFGYSGVGGVYTTSAAISGASDQPLYQSERWTWPGELQYDFAVPAGTYTVNLKFAENYATAAGQRVFNIVINGQTVLASFDIFAQAGGASRAIDKQFTVSSSGAITIQFTPVVGGPKVNGIEIF